MPDAQDIQAFPTEGEMIAVGTSVYQIGPFLNQGSFGRVYMCSDRWANELVAKVLIPRATSAVDVREAWIREASNLLALRHPNITYIYDVCVHRGAYYIIVERCSSDLHNLFSLPDYNCDLWFPTLSRDVLQAIEFIHRAGFIHKDLHPGNIFLSFLRDRMVPQKNPVLQFKVGDLGITREASHLDIFNTVLAQWMLPPEALEPTEYGPVGLGIDVYHIGLVLLSVLLGRVPTFTREEILDATPRRTAESINSRYAPAVALALRRHATARPNIIELWQHIWDVIPADSRPF